MNLLKQPKGSDAAYWIDKGKGKAEKSWYQHGYTWTNYFSGQCPEGKCVKRRNHPRECWPL